MNDWTDTLEYPGIGHPHEGGLRQKRVCYTIPDVIGISGQFEVFFLFILSLATVRANCLTTIDVPCSKQETTCG